MTTEWSPQQERAITMVERWLDQRYSPSFMLAGYAGTGKTTLAKYLAARVKGTVCFAAFTGKAALVLGRAGCPSPSTIHSLIYQRVHKGSGTVLALEADLAELKAKHPEQVDKIRMMQRELEKLKESASAPSFILNPESALLDAALLVIDEYSMIDDQMGRDLMSFEVPVLALGDPGQLPPVFGESYFRRQPDVLLTEIHRQNKDNPIIQMAAKVRAGGRLTPGQYGKSNVATLGDIRREELTKKILACDQLLVGKNETRTNSNRRVRELLGRTSTYPVAGDKLVCLRNQRELGMFNGEIWTAATDAAETNSGRLEMVVQDETGRHVEVTAHAHYFRGEKPEFYEVSEASCFDYGYALTVHKAQGSQWDSVVLLDEWRRNDRDRWLYTAITRAAKRIDIVQM